jgi:phage shock protein A
MSIFSKLITLVRGTASDAGEAIIDANATKILDQEIRDANANLKTATSELTNVMAEQIASERKVKSLTASIEEHEGYVISALDAGDEGLALEIAEKIGELEVELNSSKAVFDSQNANVKSLKDAINKAKKSIKAIEREVSMVKATEAVNKAQSASSTAAMGSNSAVSKATDSLDRIKKRQQKHADKMKAAGELAKESDGNLDAKLQKAGIIKSQASTKDILDRIKNKK